MGIRVLVNGALGKMGSEAVKAVNADPDLELVAKTDLKDDLAAVIRQSKAQVAVDFTDPASVFHNILTLIDAGVCPVVGTTGLLLSQIEELQARASKLQLGGIIAPNFAIGAVLMMKYAADAARYLPDVEIIELHHNMKIDSPSGTAVKTSEMIAENRASFIAPMIRQEIIPGARGAENHQIRIHSVRLPGLVAHQSVIFGGQGQTLTIRHDTINRESFMPGVILSCKKAVELKQIIYGLENIL